MRALVYEEYGTPDVLELREIDVPAPGDDEVLVRVRASSLNSWDWDLLTGASIARFGARRPRYPVLGADVAGLVEAVGPGTSRFDVGDAVFGDVSGCRWGGLADYVVADASILAPVPDGLSFAHAASIPQAGVLASQSLRKADLRSGRRLLIVGAGGGVGTFATQLATGDGVHVTAVDRGDKLDMLRSIGADDVVDYTTTDFARLGRRFDAIIDVVARRSVFTYRRLLTVDGALVVVGGTIPAMLQAGLLGPVISLVGTKRMGLLVHRPNADHVADLGRAVVAGDLAPVIDRVYPLEEAPEAFRRLGSGEAHGKLVIEM